MQLEGKSVTHQKYGKGIIKEVSGNTIVAAFSETEKRFLYPDAFSQFLTLNDERVQTHMDDLLIQEQQREEAERQAAQKEQERIRRLSHFKISPTSQAAFGCVTNTPQDVFSEWRVQTGRYLSGCSKGEPKIPHRMKPNSACLITACSNHHEDDRRILGAFMVREDFFGESCADGVIESHNHHRIALSPDETLQFWDYFAEPNQQRRWGSAEVKYFSNQTMRQILFDITRAVTDPQQQETAQALYQYFCKINRLPYLKPEALEA
ncbi:hypothetical protein [Butyricicoccus sp. Marseille-Q5471]|uniref:hypothetical protein n=1 Tax=Butyricicoccus sp. Marseille-Q5471 TaxID=3039493 RepID=UPI0024BD361D|nr:hypothetical protein [Butyricicoccus sp. Marseille-Q5471]